MPTDDKPPPKDKDTQSKTRPSKPELTKDDKPTNTKAILYTLGAVAAVVLLIWIF